jgi:hypothetical protein
MHSVFSDAEADTLVSAWEIVTKEKQVRYYQGMAEALSLEAWMALHGEAWDRCSQEAWQARYPRRADAFQYTHLYYILRKP